jgi:hypothetical protein
MFVRSHKNLNKSAEIQLFGTHMESKLFERKKEFTCIQEIFAKIINTNAASESGFFYGGVDSRRFMIHTQRQGSPNEV